MDAVSREAIQVCLWWKVEQTPPLNYSIALHVLDAEGKLVASVDGPITLYNGLDVINTPQLEPGKIYIDFRRIILLPVLPAGLYQLDMVVYDLQTGTRLTLSDGGDHLPLDTITIP